MAANNMPTPTGGQGHVWQRQKGRLALVGALGALFVLLLSLELHGRGLPYTAGVFGYMMTHGQIYPYTLCILLALFGGAGVCARKASAGVQNIVCITWSLGLGMVLVAGTVTSFVPAGLHIALPDIVQFTLFLFLGFGGAFWGIAVLRSHKNAGAWVLLALSTGLVLVVLALFVAKILLRL